MKRRLGAFSVLSFCSILSLCAAAELLVGGVSLSFPLRSLPILLCLPANQLLKRVPAARKKQAAVLIGAAVTVSVGLLTGIFRDFCFAKLLLLLAAAFDASVLLRAGETRRFAAWLPLCALLLAAAAVVKCFFRMETGVRSTALGFGGLLSGLIWLFLLNRESRQHGAHNAESQEALPVPKALKRANQGMVALFLLCAAVLGLLSAGLFPRVIRGAAGLASGAVDGAVFIGRSIEKLVAEKPGTSGANPVREKSLPSPSPQPTAEPITPRRKAPEALRNGAFSRFAAKRVIPAVLLLFILAAAVRVVLRRQRKNETREDTGYTDEVERLRAVRRVRSGRRSLSRRGTQRYADMKTDRMRLRFLWWTLLKRPPQGWNAALTPRETAALLDPEWTRLSERYSLARYAPETPLPPDSAQVAAEFAGKLNAASGDRA